MARIIFAQDPEKYVPALADALKKIPEFTVPAWARFVKSGTSRQRPPAEEDFWHVRAASILRQLYLKGVLGVGKLRSRYGSRKDRGGKPDEFRKASGKIIRVILQQAEQAGLVEKISRMQHGRRLTQQGRDFLDSITVEGRSSLSFEELKIKRVPEETIEENEDETMIQENVEDTEESEEVSAKNDEEKTVEKGEEEAVKTEEKNKGETKDGK